MKATILKPRMRVLLQCGQDYLEATVIKRIPRNSYGLKARTIISVKEFVGLRGPADQGIVELSDYEVSRKLQPIEC